MSFSAILAVVTGVIAPLFAVALLGLLAGIFKLVPKEGVRSLNAYVYLFATPALLFLGLSNVDFVTAFKLNWVLAYYIPTLGIHVLAILIFRRLFNFSFIRSGVLAQGATFSNSVVIGIPITYAAWGEVALPQAFTIIGLHMVFHHSLIMLFAAFEMKTQKPLSVGFLSRLLFDYVRHPIVLAVTAGILASFTGFKVTGSLHEILSLLARSQAPVGLFTLGLALSCLRISGDFKQSCIIICANSFLLPLGVFVFCTQIFDFDRLTTAVLVMIATAPIGMTANLYAIHYNTAQRAVATGIVISTFISIFSLSFVVVGLSP